MNRDRVVALVWDLIDNMSSVGESEQDFLVDTSWANDLIQEVLHGEPEPTYAKVGWVSVSRQSFHPIEDLEPGRFGVYRKENS